MKTLLAAALAAFLLGGCASTSKTTKPLEDPKVLAQRRAESARTVVKTGLQALKDGDTRGFQAVLSSERKSAATPDWVALWLKELKAVQDFQIRQFVPTEGGRGVVKVQVRFASGADVVAIRVREEGGSWRWDER